MAVESATTINQLDPTKPGINDLKSEGDDHIRLLKSTIKNTLPNLTAPVTATHADLNKIAGAAAGAVAGFNVATQPAADNTTLAASTAMVQSAILSASGITAALPGQAGNAGKVLGTNGTAANWVDAVPGAGGTTANAPLALTAVSPAVQAVTASNWGQAVTLPDATTLTRGVTVFGIHNAGRFPFAINDAAGNLLGFVEVGRHVICSLADNTTAAGNWDLLGHEIVGRDVQGSVTFGSDVGTTNTLRRVVIDASRTLLLVSGALSLHGVVYNHSTQTFGAPVLIRAANISGRVQAALTAANQVLVVSCPSSSTALEAVILTLAGTTITVNTAAAATLAGTVIGMGNEASHGLIQFGTSWLFGYTRSTAIAGIRALTIAGTTVTIGAELATTGTDIVPVVYRVTDSVALVFSQVAGGTITAQCVTVAGSTLTAGGSANITSNTTDFITRQAGSRWMVVTRQTANIISGSVVSVSGTAPTISTVTLLSGNAFTDTFAAHFIGNQLAVMVRDDSSSSSRINLLTDNSGTAVAGTQITRVIVGSATFYSGGTASEMWVQYLLAINQPVMLSLGASGNNLTVLHEMATGANASTTLYPGTSSTNYKDSGIGTALMFNERGSLPVAAATSTRLYFTGRGSRVEVNTSSTFVSALSVENTAALWVLDRRDGTNFNISRIRLA